jgi:hypothetical protein
VQDRTRGVVKRGRKENEEKEVKEKEEAVRGKKANALLEQT